MKKSIVLSSLALAGFAVNCAALAQGPVIIPPRPIIITPHLGNIINRGYAVDKRVVLKSVNLQTFKIPNLPAIQPANEAELLRQNEIELMTKGNNEFVTLRKQIPLADLRAWKNITLSYEPTFIPNIGVLRPEPPAGVQTEDGARIIGPIGPIGPIRPIGPIIRPNESDNNSDENIDFLQNENVDDNAIESILGTDSRSQINPTTGYPWRAIGMVGGHCSGVLIGPRHVLTAAHCVYDVDTNQWIQNLDFTPGKNGNTVPYGTIPWSMVIAKKGWTQDHNGAYDWAMIVLSQPIGNNIGWLGYGYNYAQPVINLNTAGYPGDKPFGSMWKAYCPNTVFPYVVSAKVSHTCDTWPGQSGSPMWMYIGPDYRSVRAVHTNGSSAGLNVPNGNHNSATIIDSYVFNTLKRWKTENP